jgi:hypothetical protein
MHLIKLHANLYIRMSPDQVAPDDKINKGHGRGKGPVDDENEEAGVRTYI